MTKGDKIKLRAELAGKAMQGILSDAEVMRAQLEGEEGKLVNHVIAKEAVAFADALMKELGLDGERYMYGSSLDGMFGAMLVFLIAVGIAIAGVCFWLIPWLWSLVKPWLHMVTA